MDDILNGVLDDVNEGVFDPSAPATATPVNPSIPDPVNDAINTIASQTETGNGFAVLKAARANPDKYQEQKELADNFAVPVDFAARNEDKLKARKAEEDIAGLLLDHPEIAEWYKAGDNVAAIKVDELRELSGIEWLWKSGGQASGAGFKQVDLGQARFNQLMGIATDEEVARADFLSGSQENRTFAADSWLEKGFVGTAQQLPILMQSVIEGLQGGVVGAGAGAGAALVAGQLGPQVATPEEIVTVPGAAATGFVIGTNIARWQAGFKIEAGLAYDEFKQIQDENGQLIDDGTARVAALIAGSAAASLELIGLNTLLKSVPGAKDLKGLAGKAAVKNALKNPQIRTALADFSKSVFKSGVTEITTEVLQEAVTIFAGESAKAFENFQGGDFGLTDGDDIQERLKETAIQTAQTMTILGPALSSSKLGVDLAKISKTRKEFRIIEALNAAAEGSEFNKRLPNKSKEAIAKLTENGPIQHVYVAPEGFNELFQDDAELADFAARAGITEELAEARQTGRDVEIPIGVYYTSIAGTEAGAALQQFTKLSQDGFNNQEAEDFNAAWQETQTQLFEEFEAGELSDTANLQGEEIIHDDVKTRAMNSGIVPDQAEQYAKLYSTFFRVLGERTGNDPSEIYKKYGFEIRRPIPQVQEFKETGTQELAFEVIRRGQVDGIRKKATKLRGPSILDAIKNQGGITDPGGDLFAAGLSEKLIKQDRADGDVTGDTGNQALAAQATQISQDDTAQRLWEAGYFPEFQERPSVNDLLDAIGDEISGNAQRFAVDSQGSQELARAEGIIQFADALDEFGLDPNTMTDEEILAEIEKINSDADQDEALFQEADNSSIAEKVFNDFRVSRGVKLGAKTKIWRGISTDTLSGMATYGQGLYTTSNKSHAKKFAGNDGRVVEMDRGDLPSNALRFDTINDYEIWFQGAEKEAGFDGPRERQAAGYIEPDHFIKSIDAEIDGLQIGTGKDAMFVNWQGRELFQEVKTIREDVKSFADNLEKKYSLRSLSLFLGNNNDLKLNMIAVNKDKQGAGTGTKVMEEISDFADQYGLRVTLTTGQKDDGFGTTSSTRLKGFYKRFGFVENKGRNKDFSISENMFREPSREFNQNVKGFAEWQGEDMVTLTPNKNEKEYFDLLTNNGPENTIEEYIPTAVYDGEKMVLDRQAIDDMVAFVLDDKAAHGASSVPPRIRSFFQKGDKQFSTMKRGSIQLSEGRTIINMFEAADLSTFLHESGHFFLEVFRDLAEIETPVDIGPPTQILRDWNIIKKEFGIDDTGEVTTEAHEKFARSFEAYLFEGKSPSNEVSGIMARFRSWLAFVYKSVSQLNVDMNPKITGIFDRMLATDGEIASAQTGANFRPALKSAEDAGMSPKQWDDYTETAAKAVDSAKRELDIKMMEEVSRTAKREWKDAKREITAEVTEQYKAMPVYEAMDFLRTGKGTMDAQAIEDIIGDGALNKMPRSVPPLYRRKGGEHPDTIAELFDFDSGYHMLQVMMSAGPMKAAIKQEVDVRMKDRFGDLLGDAVARSREAEAAINNDETGDLLQAEMEIFLRKGGLTTKLNKEGARRAARQAVREKPIREAIRHRLYMRANEKAATQAEKAILAGDWVAAVDAKKKQILNHYMAIEAREAEKDTEKHVRYLNRFAGRKRPKNIDPDYLDQIEGLLERFDFRKSISLKDTQRRSSLADWITAQEELGAIVQIDDVLRNDAFRKPYREMAVDDLGALTDAVKNIEHIGRLKDKLVANKKQRDFEAVRDELVVTIGTHQAKIKDKQTRNPTTFDKLISSAKSMESSLLKMEQVFDWMDGGDINGPMRRYVWQPIADAEVAENDMRVKYTGDFVKIFEGLDQKRLAQQITIDGLDQTFDRSEIMAVALNMGNEGNLDKMLRGETWDTSTLDTLTAHLNEQEWKAVQNIWDSINTLWPDIAALQKRLTGVEPPKVEAREVETPYGTLKGGYYPLIYDPERSAEVEDRNAAAGDRLFENTYLRPETRHGFTKERSQAYTKPLLFDINGAGNHITAVIHDLTHREAILDANKLLTNSVVRNEIEQRYGKELYRQVLPWLQSIAHDGYQNDGLNAVNQLFRGIRSRATIMGMGFRISTILTQLAGYSSALEMVSAKNMAGAMKDFMLHPQASWERVNELSGEMRFRSATMDRDIKEQIRNLTGKSGILNNARKFAFAGIGFMDKVVTVPSWTAAYNEHLSKYPGDTQGAIAQADQVVRLSQGSGGAKDLAAVSRNNELTKLLTMFYSYFSAYYNRQRKWGRDAKRAIENNEVGDLPELLARQVFMTVGPAIVAELLVGRGPSEENEEGYAEWAARKVLFYPLAAVPVARDAFGVFDRGFGYSFTPGAQTIDAVLIQPTKLMIDISAGEAEPRQAVKTSIKTVGYALKLPTGQLSSTVDNVWKAIEEDDLKLRDFVLTRNK